MLQVQEYGQLVVPRPYGIHDAEDIPRREVDSIPDDREMESKVCEVAGVILLSSGVIHHFLDRRPVNRLTKLPECRVDLRRRRRLRTSRVEPELDAVHLHPRALHVPEGGVLTNSS